MIQPWNLEQTRVPHSLQSRTSTFDSIQAHYLQGSAASTVLSPQLYTLDPSRFLTGLGYFVNVILDDDLKQSRKPMPNSSAVVRGYPVPNLLDATLRNLDNPYTILYLCNTATALWISNKPREARILLDQASEILKYLVFKERLGTFTAILYSVATFESFDHAELAAKFLDLASGMSAILLGATHSITIA